MLVDFRVIAIEDCTRCEGTGYIEHPWWTTYRLCKPDNSSLPDDITHFPPEETPCPGCQGAGTIRREVPLIEALRQLNIRPDTNVRGPFIKHVPERITA